MNIIVTGASSGIGYEVVKEFSKNKSNNIVAVARNKNHLKKLQDDCEQSYGNKIIIYKGDIGEELFAKSFIEFYLKHLNKVNIVLNNAGQLINKPFKETTYKDIEHLFKVNLFGTIQLIKEVIPISQPSHSHIVNIGSMGGYQGSLKFPGLSIYSSSKAALANLTECLAEELADTGVKFNCLALGAVQTKMLEKAFPEFKAPISAKDMAVFISDFCINGSKYYNGKVLPVSISTP